MDADRIRLKREKVAIDRLDHPRLDQADDSRGYRVGILDHRDRHRPRDQRSVGMVGTVGKGLADDGQSGLDAGRFKGAARNREEQEVSIELVDSLGNGSGDCHILYGQIVKSAMCLDVLER